MTDLQMLRGKMRYLIGALLVLLSACSGGPTQPTAPAPSGSPRVLVLSSLIGYVEPCGCTVDLLLGGIDRVAAMVAAERAKGPTAVVVVGPTLFEHALEPHQVAQEEAKAKLIAQALGHIGVDAIVPTHEDLLQGAAFAKALPGEDVTVNVPGGAGRLLDLGGAKIGVIGVVATGEAVPKGVATDPIEAAQAAAQRLRAQGAQAVIGLAGVERKDLRLVAQGADAVDLWILGRHPKEGATASTVGGAYVIEAGDRGRNVGRLIFDDLDAPGALTDPVGDVVRKKDRMALRIKMRRDMARRMPSPTLNADIAKIEAEMATLQPPATPTGKRFAYDLIALPKTASQDAQVTGWLDAYNAQLKQINLANAGDIPPVPPGKAGYLGDAVCAECHPDAKAFWDTTRHAHAWQTLVDDDKTFDATCVSCHVVGFQKPGGTVLGKVEGKTNVQCEACHGPGSLHVERGGTEHDIKRKVPAAVCETCHHPHHSPKFDYATYLPKILGEGHQKAPPTEWRGTTVK